MAGDSALIGRFRLDFEFYAERCLRILTKGGDLVPFKLNRAQRYIHQKLEEQRERIGKVRAIVLKGRQQGASTYIGGRYYHRSSGEFGKRVQILTHEIPATNNLFKMTQRYHRYCPAEVKPATSNSSATELVFKHLDTRYSIATAGSQATGRSATAQYFHGSEVAFWPHAEEHMAGVGQVVPNEAGTEIILESTANGIGNLFHRMVMSAMRGRGDYQLIFVPWFWEGGYRRPVPADFMLEDDEIEYQSAFGLADEQMAWRRWKIADDFGADVSLFNQEYPATVEMAFQAASNDALIPPGVVLAARKRPKPDGIGPLIMTLDPAEYGDDDSVFGRRRGRLTYPFEAFHGRGPMEMAGMAAERLEKYRPDAFCVDVTGGYGRGIVERLQEQKFKNIYTINFGEKALAPELYSNRRAEMYALMRDWLRDQEPYLPDDDVLASELSSVTYHYDSSRRLVLTSKEKMRTNGIPSPDRADALALTFSVRVADRSQTEVPAWKEKMMKQRRLRRSAMAG